MDELLETMSDDWIAVFKHRALRLNQFHVKKLAGLDPNKAEDRVTFGKHLGLKKNFVAQLDLRTAEDIDAISADDSAAEDDEGRPLPASGKKFSKPLDDFPVTEHHDLISCFTKWVERGRTLLSLKTITDQRSVLEDLNTFLCHVQKRSLSR